jgi:hypothetical protein
MSTLSDPFSRLRPLKKGRKPRMLGKQGKRKRTDEGKKTDEILPTPKKRKGKGNGKGMVNESATLGTGEGKREVTGNPTATQVQTLPSITEIGRVASLCAEAFRNATNEHEREEYTWTVFRLVADEFKVKVVDDIKGMIRQCFDEVQPCRVVEELREMDIHVARMTKAYKLRTEDLFQQYNWLSKTNTKLYKTESLKAMWLSLKKEGFRFLEQEMKHGDDVMMNQWTGSWQEMTPQSATEFLSQRMINIARLARRDVKTQKAFAMNAPLPPQYIVCDKSNEKKGNPANTVYRKTISKNAHAFKNGETKAGKTEIANRVIDDLQQQGYSFVVKKDGVWSTMETGELLKRVSRNLKDCARDRDCKVERNPTLKKTKQGRTMQPVETKESTILKVLSSKVASKVTSKASRLSPKLASTVPSTTVVRRGERNKARKTEKGERKEDDAEEKTNAKNKRRTRN